MSADLILSTLLSPIVLFFVLGLGAALMRSQMSVPESFAKGLAIYLMMAIGLKGGVEMSKTALSPDIFAVAGVSLALSFGLPFIAYMVLRFVSKMSRIDAAATAGHYGSISIVTFVAATQALQLAGIVSSGYMVAMAALMEVPAIMSALILAQRGMKKEGEIAGSEKGELFREVFLNASVVVLVGALAIGWISGEAGMEKIAPFFVTPFQGVLCLFLILGMSVGNSALLITLAASASYIAVPAAMRLALPKAQPSIYLTLSLGVTFPFNLTLGIPLYIILAQIVGG